VPFSRAADSPRGDSSRSPVGLPTGYYPGQGDSSKSPRTGYDQEDRSRSPASSIGEFSRSPPGMRGGLSSIFSQPGYTTSFLNKPVSPIPPSSGVGVGYQNRNFQEPSAGPLSTSTPMTAPSGNGFREGAGRRPGDTTFSFSTPPVRPYPASDSMITHPGSINSQLEASKKRVRPDSGDDQRSDSEDGDSLHSSSSEDYTENKVPETAELQDPAGMRKGSSRRSKGSKKGMRGLIFENKGAVSSAPKIVKTTTKQTVVKDNEGIRHDKHERVEDLTPGGSGMVTVSTTSKEVCFK
jgi:hypothetical protein